MHIFYYSTLFFSFSTTTWPSPPDFYNTPSENIEDFLFSLIVLLENEENNEICKQARNREETLYFQQNRIITYSNAREHENKRLFENSKPIPKVSFTEILEKRKIDKFKFKKEKKLKKIEEGKSKVFFHLN